MERSPVDKSELSIGFTVGMLTRNSAETLEAALASVEGADEILIADGNSTDSTRKIAVAAGARTIDQSPAVLDHEGRLIDIAGAREQLLAESSHDIVFFLDSDEIATPLLLAEIRNSCVGSSNVGSWRVPRKYLYESRVIEVAMNYPSFQARVVNRRGVSGYAGLVHDVPVLNDDWATSALENHQLVPLPPLRILWKRWHSYLKLEEHKNAGLERSDWWSSVVKPTAKTVKWYLYRLYKTRGRKTPNIIPLRYDLSRVAYVALVPLYIGRRFLGWRVGAITNAWD